MKKSRWLVRNSIDVTELKTEGNSENCGFSKNIEYQKLNSNNKTYRKKNVESFEKY